MIAANVPLYQLVKQDYIPTNVDESEFEVSIYAPEGRQHRVDGGDDRRASSRRSGRSPASSMC